MNKICPAYGIQMGTILGQIFGTFHKDGGIFVRNFLYISVKWVHFSDKNVCTLGHKFVPEPSMSKIHREPPPGISILVIQSTKRCTTLCKFSNYLIVYIGILGYGAAKVWELVDIDEGLTISMLLW